MDEYGNANSALAQLLRKRRHDHEENSPRREKPHIAIVTFKIDIRPVNPDNSFESYKLSNRDLEKYNMTHKAQIIVKGPSEAECVKKVKQTLEKMNER